MNTEINKSDIESKQKLFNKLIDEFKFIKVNEALLYLNYTFPEKPQNFIISDVVTGIWSNIPNCCNYAFSIDNIYHTKFKEQYGLTEFDLLQYNYVPCINCYNNNYVVPIKRNGWFDYNKKLNLWEHYNHHLIDN